MANKVKPIPDGYHSVTPYLVVEGAAKAIDFYKKVFDATELMRMTSPDGADRPCRVEDRRFADHAR